MIILHKGNRKELSWCFQTWCFFLRIHFLTERKPALRTAPVQLKLAVLLVQTPKPPEAPWNPPEEGWCEVVVLLPETL